MQYIRKGQARGGADFGWLKSKHSFSFGHYYDPAHMGFSVLRVINDDTVAPGTGFDTHGHRDMEIISYVLSGDIEHKDSMGKHSVLSAGEVQRISAGRGITHSEYNHSSTQPLHFLQIWIEPDSKNLTPSYEQRAIEQNGQLTALVTPDGREGSLRIHQDASIHRLALNANDTFALSTDGRSGYLHLIEGRADVNGNALNATDAIGLMGEPLNVHAHTELTALWFDLPAIGIN